MYYRIHLVYKEEMMVKDRVTDFSRYGGSIEMYCPSFIGVLNIVYSNE